MQKLSGSAIIYLHRRQKIRTGHYLTLYCNEFNIPQKPFSEDTLKMLISKRWNGNVRELQNEIKRGLIFSKCETIMPEDFQYELKNLPCSEDTIQLISKVTYKEAKRTLQKKF